MQRGDRMKPIFQWRYALMLLLCYPLLIAHAAGGFDISEFSAHLDDDTYYLNADVDYRLTEAPLEALQNGVPLTFEVHVQLRRSGAWLWESDLFEVRLRYQLKYHALAELYQVIELASGSEQNFVTRDAALAALGKIRNIGLIKQDQLEPGQSYGLSIKSVLDIEALPLPLRPMAHLTPDWNLSSERKLWYLRP
ncbi:MAG: DUF4390 domain-containing protein [Chromatiales bacterium]|nr:DUF4390 domain-containing protein [Chromatiales bacterium]